MAQLVRATSLFIIAVASFTAAILAGMNGAGARAPDPGPGKAICCIYMIF